MADVASMTGRALVGYLAMFVIWAVVGTVIGSFILWELWTPFDTMEGRMALAWMSLIGLLRIITR